MSTTWFVVCQTCPVRIELPGVRDETHALWHLNYHKACYYEHDCKITAQPNPRRRRRGAEEMGENE